MVRFNISQHYSLLSKGLCASFLLQKFCFLLLFLLLGTRALTTISLFPYIKLYWVIFCLSLVFTMRLVRLMIITLHVLDWYDFYFGFSHCQLSMKLTYLLFQMETWTDTWRILGIEYLCVCVNNIFYSSFLIMKKQKEAYEITLLSMAPHNNCWRWAAVRREWFENNGMPVGYSGRGAVKREQCDMTHKSLNSGARIDGHC
jgi:hypothetical protein